MKLKTDERFKHFESKEHIQMGLDLENSHSIMSLLRNNIYSNPIQSWVREIYSNAVDAHARINNTTDSIRITIEEEDSHNLFIVRDFGPSMDKETIANVYAKMGKSDKRSGNNEMGGWGLGAKSPLAYTDHFWVETFTREGECNIYRKWVQYIDASRVGALGLLEEKFVNGTFKTGTRVSIPYERKDHRNVTGSLLLYLSYTNAKYELEGLEYKSQRPNYRFYGEDWALGMYKDYYWSGRSSITFKDKGIVIVGDIPYRVDFTSLYKFFEDNNLLYTIQDLIPKNSTIESDMNMFNNFLTALRVYEFQVELPIGSIDLSASREDLQYTRHTCVNMYKQMYKMFIHFCTEIKLNLIYRNDLPEACIRFENDYGGFMRETVLKDIKWHKEPISFSGNISIFSSPCEAKKYKLEQTYGKSRKIIMKGSDCYDIELGTNKYFIVKQDTDYVNYSKFVKFYLLENDYEFTDYFVVVDKEDFKYLRNWVKENFEILNMSELISFHKENYVRSAVVNKADKGKFKTLIYQGNEAREKADGLGKYFDYGEVEIEPEETYYYLLKEYYINSSFKFLGWGSYLWKALNSFLETRGISRSNLVYTTKITRNYKGENWVNFMDYINSEVKLHESKIETYLKSLFVELTAERQFKLVSLLNTNLVENKDGLFSTLQKEYRSAKKYIQENKSTGALLHLVNPFIRKVNEDREHWSTKIYNKSIIEDKFESYSESIYNEFKIFEEYFSKYKLLNTFNRGYWDNRDMDLTLEDAADYINTMSIVNNEVHKEKEELPNSSFQFSSLISRFN